MRNLLDKASVAQSLDGRLKGSLHFPLEGKVDPSGSFRKRHSWGSLRVKGCLGRDVGIMTNLVARKSSDSGQEEECVPRFIMKRGFINILG